MAHDVFISHSSKDKPAADAVCAALERAGVRCWVAPRDILSGANWAESIVQAIADSRMMILVFSRHAQESQHIRREVERAVHHGIAIAPVRIEDVMPAGDLEYFLGSSHWMDAMTPPLSQHLEALCQQVQGLLRMDPRPAAASPAAATAAATSASHAPPVVRTPWAPGAPARWAPGPPTPNPVTPPSRTVTLVALLAVAAFVLVAGAALGTWAVVRGRSGHTPEAASDDRQHRTDGPQAMPPINNDAYGRMAPAAPAQADPAAAHLRDQVSTEQVPQPFTNSVGMKLVPIRPGTFRMGSPPSEKGRDLDETLHLVRLTRGYYLAAHLVTRRQFDTFIRTSGYRTDAERDGLAAYWTGQKFERRRGASWQDPGFEQADDHPAVNVSWNDAVAYGNWLNQLERRHYRLPTEAEWEYACRAGTQAAYPWGDDPDAGVGWANVADQTAKQRFPDWAAFNWSDGYVFTSPVGSFKPNGWGLYDMIGNALEWCADWYDVYPAGDVTDPTGPPNPPAPDRAWRVLRGGSCYNSPRGCRSADRSVQTPGSRNFVVGFRLALDF